MKNGERRRALPSATICEASKMVCSPPMPEPIITPVAQASASVTAFQPESATASSAATRASWMKRSIFRWSLCGIHSSRSSRPSAFVPEGTWPAIFAGRSFTSKDWMAPMPLSPASRRFQTCSTPIPSGVTTPIPVTTTRRMALAFPPLPAQADFCFTM